MVSIHGRRRAGGAGHARIEKLRARIDQVVERYIAALKDDAAHPFLSRRARNFRYAARGRRGFAIAASTSIISIQRGGSALATMSRCPRRRRTKPRARAGSSSVSRLSMAR